MAIHDMVQWVKQWVHIVGMCGMLLTDIYVNGCKLYHDYYDGSFVDKNKIGPFQLLFGKHFTHDGFANISIDEFYLWEREVSAETVQMVFAGIMLSPVLSLK